MTEPQQQYEEHLPDIDDLPMFQSADAGLDIPPVLPVAPHPEPTTPVEQPQLDPEPNRPTSTPAPREDDAFWAEVAELRGILADRMTKLALPQGSEDERIAGMGVITEVVRDHADGLLRTGMSQWDEGAQRDLRDALYAGHFGLGRLQPYVDDETVENIEVYSHTKVALIHTDGAVEWVGPIARSAEELREYIASLATRHGHAFTPARPQLFMSLPGKVRLTAAGFGHTPDDETHVFLRMQRLRDVNLDRLVAVAEIDTVLRDFLSAAVAANRTIVVSGQAQGSGKTTLVKALGQAIPAYEHVVTIESDFELYLPESRPRTHQLRALPPAGEDLTVIPTTGDLTGLSLRANADRVIVGEVRTAEEIDALVRAMQGGNGTLSTLHADSAADVIEVLTTLVGTSTGSVPFARRQVAQMVHLIVYLGVDIDPSTGRRYRYVREVLEVEPGENGEPATQQIFAPGPDRRGVPTGIISDKLRDHLARVGYSGEDLLAYRGSGTWQEVKI